MIIIAPAAAELVEPPAALEAAGAPVAGALLEELVYSEDGQLLTASLADYLLPTVGLLDGIQIHHMESESQLNPLGAKGIGEAADKAAARKPTMHLLPYGIPLCLGFISYLIYQHGL